MRDETDSRFANLFRGAAVGLLLALAIFGTSFYLSSPKLHFRVDRATWEAFVAFVSWPWFGGVVGAVALYAFIFNIRLSFSPWDMFDSVRDFKKD